MTAHILIPAIDPEWPATLSPQIVDGMLKTSLGFGGLVLTDDLAMKAISDRGTGPPTRRSSLSRPAATPCCCAARSRKRRWKRSKR